MPTYDYECEACGHTFERFQEITARKLRTCPKCGKRKLHRLIGRGMGLIFRGSGFYETDYKRAARPKKEEGGPSSGASSSKTGESSPAKTPKPAKTTKTASGSGKDA